MEASITILVKKKKRKEKGKIGVPFIRFQTF